MPCATPPWIWPSTISRVDQVAAVVHDDVALDGDHRRLGVDLDDHGVHAVGGAAAVGAEVGSRLEAGLDAGGDGAAQRIGLAGQLDPG